MISSKRKFVILILLLLIGAGVGLAVVMSAGKESTDDAQLEADIATISPARFRICEDIECR